MKQSRLISLNVLRIWRSGKIRNSKYLRCVNATRILYISLQTTYGQRTNFLVLIRSMKWYRSYHSTSRRSSSVKRGNVYKMVKSRLKSEPDLQIYLLRNLDRWGYLGWLSEHTSIDISFINTTFLLSLKTKEK